MRAVVLISTFFGSIISGIFSVLHFAAGDNSGALYLLLLCLVLMKVASVAARN